MKKFILEVQTMHPVGCIFAQTAVFIVEVSCFLKFSERCLPFEQNEPPTKFIHDSSVKFENSRQDSNRIMEKD